MIYLCAGMYRSGSTWLYNAIRVILQRSGAPDLAAGVIADKDKLLKHRNAVIKVHAYDADLAAKADFILVSHRDLRDVAASLRRKFLSEFSTAAVRETFNDYTKWLALADYDLRYEQLLTDKIAELQKIATALRLPSRTLGELPYAAIAKELDAEKFTEQRSTPQRYDAVNLLHDGHITDGRHGSWKNFVPDDIIAEIEKEFHGWMLAQKYLEPHAAGLVGDNQK